MISRKNELIKMKLLGKVGTKKNRRYNKVINISIFFLLLFINNNVQQAFWVERLSNNLSALRAFFYKYFSEREQDEQFYR